LRTLGFLAKSIYLKFGSPFSRSIGAKIFLEEAIALREGRGSLALDLTLVMSE